MILAERNRGGKMGPRWLGILLILGAISTALAGGPAIPATQPLIPVDDIPVPGERLAPVAPPAAPAVVKGNVVILPFEMLGDLGHRDWVARAVQESLAAEVARQNGFLPITVATAGASDTAAARETAKSVHGDIVIFGACQFSGPQIRLTGQVVELSAGQSLGGLKVSGDFTDLFSLEDQLGAQVRLALAPPPVTATMAAARAKTDAALIFGNEIPITLSADDLYAPQPDTVRFADEYNRYNFDWGDYGPYFYGGYYGPSFGWYYPPFRGGYYSVIIVSPVGHRGGYGHRN
jgi:TolB-like protein